MPLIGTGCYKNAWGFYFCCGGGGGSPGEEIVVGRDRERFLANGDGDDERRTATATIEVGSPTDLPFFVVFLHICKIVVPIGFGFFCYLYKFLFSTTTNVFTCLLPTAFFF